MEKGREWRREGKGEGKGMEEMELRWDELWRRDAQTAHIELRAALYSFCFLPFSFLSSFPLPISLHFLTSPFSPILLLLLHPHILKMSQPEIILHHYIGKHLSWTAQLYLLGLLISFPVYLLFQDHPMRRRSPRLFASRAYPGARYRHRACSHDRKNRLQIHALHNPFFSTRSNHPCLLVLFSILRLLEPLTHGYRRIPIMQIGNNVYCDTAVILDELERRYPGDEDSHVRGLSDMVSTWVDVSELPEPRSTMKRERERGGVE